MKFTTKELIIIIILFLIFVWSFRVMNANASEGDSAQSYYNSDGTHSHTVTEGGDIIASDGTYQGRIEDDGSHIGRDNAYEGRVEGDVYIDRDGATEYYKRGDSIYESGGEHVYEIH